MKSTGIVRKVDPLGRIVIPKELRNTLGLKEGAPMGIYTEGEHILLAKYEPECVFCGEVKDVKNYKGRNICRKCLNDLRNK